MDNLWVQANYFSGLHIYALLILALETKIQSLRTPGGWDRMCDTLPFVQIQYFPFYFAFLSKEDHDV